VTQALLGFVVERGLDDLAAERGDLREDLVRGRAVDQHDHRGAAGLQLVAQVLHEVVVDTDVGQRAGRRARGRADRHAEQRHEEDQADQPAPEGAADGSAGGQLVGLMQLDLALVVTGDDDRVLELDRVLLLQSAEGPHDLFGGRAVRERDGDEIAHVKGSFGWVAPS
jgi:hypothetical protein